MEFEEATAVFGRGAYGRVVVVELLTASSLFDVLCSVWLDLDSFSDSRTVDDEVMR